jgi:hypothetical protein
MGTAYEDEMYWTACEELKDEAVTAINQIHAGKYEDAIVTLERAFLPAWEDTAACEARYREVMGRP